MFVRICIRKFWLGRFTISIEQRRTTNSGTIGEELELIGGSSSLACSKGRKWQRSKESVFENGHGKKGKKMMVESK